MIRTKIYHLVPGVLCNHADNSLYDAIKLRCDNSSYTLHIADAFYWLNVNIIATVYYQDLSSGN